MRAQWLEVWSVTYRLRRGRAWGEPQQTYVCAGKDSSEAVGLLKAALEKGDPPPAEVRVAGVERALSRVALFPGVAWQWRAEA